MKIAAQMGHCWPTVRGKKKSRRTRIEIGSLTCFSQFPFFPGSSTQIKHFVFLLPHFTCLSLSILLRHYTIITNVHYLLFLISSSSSSSSSFSSLRLFISFFFPSPYQHLQKATAVLEHNRRTLDARTATEHSSPPPNHRKLDRYSTTHRCSERHFVSYPQQQKMKIKKKKQSQKVEKRKRQCCYLETRASLFCCFSSLF